ncbi:glycosyltransferase family 4 protein [Novosphingobium pituita]|uniref:Glycosyltransferase family 4 protein n=1 Tax=Novosphingobium pituita TaxID=3056842 RepID=A0ABQ6P9M0_9SPHN|nr:glycosyltransferase family 4 protein [Novosphingobium sp. IK01]GMM61968.1 glycosyltransferase family 4 protein [Novosphingobium sp. IK01]
MPQAAGAEMAGRPMAAFAALAAPAMPVSCRRKARPDIMMIGLRSVGEGQGGVENHVDRLAGELDRMGLRVEIVTRSPYQPGRHERGRNITVRSLWAPRVVWAEALVHSLLAVAYAAWRRPAIVHIHAIGPSIVAPLARLVGLVVVMTHHGEDYRREKWGAAARAVLRLGEAAGARFSQGRIVISPSLRASLDDRFRRPFAYIPNGVCVAGPVPGCEALRPLGLEPGRYILSVGRLVPEKRQLDLIEALAQIADPAIRLVLVGGADHDSPYCRQVQARAAADPRVVLAGLQSGRPLAELYSHAGVFALPSSHEGLSIALLEAMAYGNRVVASAIAANRNLGLPEACYFPCGDVPALAEALRAALEADRQDRLAGGADSGRSPRQDWGRIVDAFRWDEVAARTAGLYRAVSREGGGPSGKEDCREEGR